MEVSAILFVRFVKVILANSYKRSSMNNQDISTIIDLHFEEMTDLEQEIARYFLQADTINDDLSSQQVTQKLHISQAALTRFAKKCGFKGYREFIFKYQQQKDKFFCFFDIMQENRPVKVKDFQQAVGEK